MGTEALIETRIDADVKGRAAVVLGRMGLTLSDAVRMLMTSVADEGSLPFALDPGDAAHEAWFRASVHEALADSTPDLPDAEVESYFARRREAALRRVSEPA